MKITLLAVGPVRTAYIREGIDMYAQRISKLADFESVAIPDVKSTRSLTEARQKASEGESILAYLKPGDCLALLDERGMAMTSREFAGFVEKRMVAGIKRLVFVIGGPYGFSDAVYARADFKVSLSKMTFPHEMARLFFTEQLYRSFAILGNLPYHHD